MLFLNFAKNKMSLLHFIILFLANIIKISSSTIDKTDNSIIVNTNKELISCKAATYCDDDQPCSDHGICYVDLFGYYNITDSNKKTRCICDIGWISIDDHDVKCCYQKKHQAIAFLLEFVVGFGVGHWYIGKKWISLLKMISISILCVIIWVTSFFNLYKKGVYEPSTQEKRIKKKNMSVWIMIISMVLFFVWQFVDAILFGINYYVDGKGHKLQEW
jgi:hypothetical protein